jgi:hypothetical protein
MKHLLKPSSSCLKAPCNDLARGFFPSATRLFYRIALIYYQFTFGDTAVQIPLQNAVVWGGGVWYNAEHEKWVEPNLVAYSEGVGKCRPIGRKF